jgi:hypothetical protein
MVAAADEVLLALLRSLCSLRESWCDGLPAGPRIPDLLRKWWYSSFSLMLWS